MTMETDTTRHGRVADTRPPAPPATGTSLMERLPALLRLAGTAALLIAMYSFLVQGWREGNDLLRYWLMLGHTGILAATGVASARWLKENKGPRLLLTLALVSVTVNFAILGALLFSRLGDTVNGSYPGYLAWTAENLDAVLFAAAGSLLVLVPVTLLGFAVLARSLAGRLSLLFLAANAALLLPSRDPRLIGALVLALTAVITLFTRQAARAHIAARTRDGILALALLLLPVGVMIGRTLWLYDPDRFLLAAMTLAIYLALRQVAGYLDRQSTWHQLVGVLALLPAASMAPLLWADLAAVPYLPRVLVLPLAFTAAAGLIYDLARGHPALGALLRWFAVAVMLAGLLGNQFLYQDAASALVSVIAGLGMSLLGYRRKQRSPFAGGLVLLLTGIAQQLYQLVHHFDLGNWLAFAIIGVAAIVIGSLLEARGGRLASRIRAWRTSVHHWDQ